MLCFCGSWSVAPPRLHELNRPGRPTSRTLSENSRFTSLRRTRSQNRSGPRPTITINGTIRRRSIMWRSAHWRSNGFASSSAAGRMASPTKKRNICSLCAGEVRCLRMLSDHPPAWRGSRSRVSKNSLKIRLDGVTQKTPLHQRSMVPRLPNDKDFAAWVSSKPD